MNFESLVNQTILMCIALNIGIRRSLTAKFAIFNLADGICRIRSLKFGTQQVPNIWQTKN